MGEGCSGMHGGWIGWWVGRYTGGWGGWVNHHHHHPRGELVVMVAADGSSWRWYLRLRWLQMVSTAVADGSSCCCFRWQQLLLLFQMPAFADGAL